MENRTGQVYPLYLEEALNLILPQLSSMDIIVSTTGMASRELSDENIQDSLGIDFVKNRINELAGMLGVNRHGEAKRTITSLLNKINLETDLHKLGICTKDAGLHIENAVNPQRMQNNPKLVSKEDIRFLLKKIISSAK